MRIHLGSLVVAPLLASFALAGCSQVFTNPADQEAGFASPSPVAPSSQCSIASGSCANASIALLSTPDNVVYTTRADVAPLSDIEPASDEVSPSLNAAQDASATPKQNDAKD